MAARIRLQMPVRRNTARAARHHETGCLHGNPLKNKGNTLLSGPPPPKRQPAKPANSNKNCAIPTERRHQISVLRHTGPVLPVPLLRVLMAAGRSGCLAQGQINPIRRACFYAMTGWARFCCAGLATRLTALHPLRVLSCDFLRIHALRWNAQRALRHSRLRHSTGSPVGVWAKRVTDSSGSISVSPSSTEVSRSGSVARS